MDFFTVRRARVRPEFASLYPELVQGVWMSAARAARLVRQADPAQQRVQACGCRRILCDLHFEFRGGRKEPRPAFPPKPTLEEPYAGALDQLVQKVRARSADIATFTTEMLRELNSPTPGEEIVLFGDGQERRLIHQRT